MRGELPPLPIGLCLYGADRESLNCTLLYKSEAMLRTSIQKFQNVVFLLLAFREVDVTLCKI